MLSRMSESEWTKILRRLEYRVYGSEIMESAKPYACRYDASAGTSNWTVQRVVGRISQIAEVYKREVRDLPWSGYRTAVAIERIA